jgi:hypothetical protein
MAPSNSIRLDDPPGDQLEQGVGEGELADPAAGGISPAGPLAVRSHPCETGTEIR